MVKVLTAHQEHHRAIEEISIDTDFLKKQSIAAVGEYVLISKLMCQHHHQVAQYGGPEFHSLLYELLKRSLDRIVKPVENAFNTFFNRSLEFLQGRG